MSRGQAFSALRTEFFHLVQASLRKTAPFCQAARPRSPASTVKNGSMHPCLPGRCSHRATLGADGRRTRAATPRSASGPLELDSDCVCEDLRCPRTATRSVDVARFGLPVTTRSAERIRRGRSGCERTPAPKNTASFHRPTQLYSRRQVCRGCPPLRSWPVHPTGFRCAVRRSAPQG